MSSLIQQIADLYPDHTKIRLGIGEGGIFIKPTIVSTVLGSCVSVTFYCRRKKTGAIFHALLPKIPEAIEAKLFQDRFKYVDSAIKHIIHTLQRRGIEHDQIEVKVFGGSEGAFNGVIRTGASNIMAAYEVLNKHKLQITASDIGGSMGRNLVFVSSTGEVFIKNHKNSLLSGKETTQSKNKFRKVAN